MNRQSHNDYWSKHQVYDALNAGCNIIEIDVIYLRGNLYLSHSWRPLSCLTYGSPEMYFEKLASCSGGNAKNIHLYIEVKTGNMKAVPLLTDLINKYPAINVLIYGSGDSGRFYVALETMWNCNLYRKKPVVWEKAFAVRNKVERVDVYKETNYRWWNRW